MSSTESKSMLSRSKLRVWRICFESSSYQATRNLYGTDNLLDLRDDESYMVNMDKSYLQLFDMTSIEPHLVYAGSPDDKGSAT